MPVRDNRATTSGAVAIGLPLKRRLEAMRDGKAVALGRQVSLSEIIEDLLAEHDKALEVESA